MLHATAYAKLNLYLHLHGKRADGYHLLESLIAFADWGDEVTVVPATGLHFTCDGPFASAAGEGEDNLVLRAARALQAECGVRDGAEIRLNKVIPVGAGLGGGSADAAATLKLLARMWGVIPSQAQWQSIALSLGADVAMCLQSKPCIARGIGEELTPLGFDLPKAWVVLLYPHHLLPTAAVYRAYKPDTTLVSPEISAENFWEVLAKTRNQLQRAAISLAPEVAETLLVLEGYPQARMSRMCGSGSSCFALVEQADSAQKMAEDIARRYPQWWVKAVPLRSI